MTIPQQKLRDVTAFSGLLYMFIGGSPMGTAGGVPTLQGSFDNGKGQLLDLIFQVYGDRLLLSMGGISGTYYVATGSTIFPPSAPWPSEMRS